MKKVIVGFVIVVIIGIFIVPEIIKRVQGDTIIKSDSSIEKNELKVDYIEINGKRRKIPSFLLLNQDSIWKSNEDYLGKVFVAEFFFTSCPTICPVMNKNMNNLYEKYKTNPNFGIVSYTIDPEHDTPKVLKQYQEHIVGENVVNWDFLTGEKDSIFTIANKGFNIYVSENAEAPGGFVHQGYFALFDKNGFLRSRRDKYDNLVVYYSGIDNENGEAPDIKDLSEDIEYLLNEK